MRKCARDSKRAVVWGMHVEGKIWKVNISSKEQRSSTAEEAVNFWALYAQNFCAMYAACTKFSKNLGQPRGEWHSVAAFLSLKLRHYVHHFNSESCCPIFYFFTFFFPYFRLVQKRKSNAWRQYNRARAHALSSWPAAPCAPPRHWRHLTALNMAGVPAVAHQFPKFSLIRRLRPSRHRLSSTDVNVNSRPRGQECPSRSDLY